MVFGLILVLMMIFRPQGILPAKRRIARARGALTWRRSSRRGAITKRFGGLTALNEVNFDLEEGHIASIIGPNGAGKTTFFNVFTGIYVPEEGTVSFRGARARSAAAPTRSRPSASAAPSRTSASSAT